MAKKPTRTTKKTTTSATPSVTLLQKDVVEFPPLEPSPDPLGDVTHLVRCLMNQLRSTAKINAVAQIAATLARSLNTTDVDTNDAAKLARSAWNVHEACGDVFYKHEDPSEAKEPNTPNA